MAFAGMCHSDEHIRTGDMVPDQRSSRCLTGRDSIYPVIGGHEGAGVVESVGENVTDPEAGRPRGDVVHSLLRSMRVLRLGPSVPLRPWRATR